MKIILILLFLIVGCNHTQPLPQKTTLQQSRKGSNLPLSPQSLKHRTTNWRPKVCSK